MDMETKLSNGDYVPDGLGGVARCAGDDALLERVLFRLTARRGQFPLLPDLGSRLYLLGRETPQQRYTAAKTYVAEALAGEPVRVEQVLLSPGEEGRMALTVSLGYRDRTMELNLTV